MTVFVSLHDLVILGIYNFLLPLSTLFLLPSTSSLLVEALPFWRVWTISSSWIGLFSADLSHRTCPVGYPVFQSYSSYVCYGFVVQLLLVVWPGPVTVFFVDSEAWGVQSGQWLVTPGGSIPLETVLGQQSTVMRTGNKNCQWVTGHNTAPLSFTSRLLWVK
jgi:hypothetical protein